MGQPVKLQPMANVADVYRALNSMRDEGVVASYAVCGGTAALFYATETLRTFDIDIFVELKQESFLVDLGPIYRWAASRAYEVKNEHIYVHGVPVQMLDAGCGIEHEAISTANLLSYEGVPVPVIKPEYIVVIYAKVGGRNRITRALDILDTGEVNLKLIAELVQRYHLEAQWNKLDSTR